MKITLLEQIQIDSPEKYFLTIHIFPEFYSFSIYNPFVEGSFFYYELDNIEKKDEFTCFQEYFFENDIFSLPFRKIFVMNHDKIFTFIPSVIYDGSAGKEEILNFLFSESGDKKALEQTIPVVDITIFHELRPDIYDFFSRSFVNLQILHYSSPFIAYFSGMSHQMPQKIMTTNITPLGVDIFCFEQGRFLLGNHYPCTHKNDMVYYILFVLRQLKFNQMDDFVYLTGDVFLKEEIVDSVKKYVNKIIQLDIAAEAHFKGMDMKSIPFEVAAISLCDL